MKPLNNLLCLAVCGLLISACATTARTDLFFGRNIPGGGHVSDTDWKTFTDSVITPRFPEGYTEWDATGKWQDTDTRQTIAESTKVVTFIGKRSGARNTALEGIIQAYISRFKQQAVLRLDAKTKVNFVSAAPGH
ncbi:DUF3574 domain-containing protein [Chitinophaga solisilvae]|uniref:DUF3574 domain-containing protein n=1 Tax=Chitinophaga solisilvae TaxID=1233460 RepID=UPI001371DF3E|nr:DUF3574 domain-containing protein [Chitinophaga solisilvae]